MTSKLHDTRKVRVKAITESIKTDFAMALGKDGFDEGQAKNHNRKGEYVIMRLRNPVKRFRTQLSEAITVGDQQKIFLENCKADNRDGVAFVSHPTNGFFSNRVILEIRRNTDESREAGVNWASPGAQTLPTSVFLLCQANSDVPQLTISTASVGFYPLQLCTVKFTSGMNDEMFVNGEAVIAYLPTEKTGRRDDEPGQHI